MSEYNIEKMTDSQLIAFKKEVSNKVSSLNTLQNALKTNSNGFYGCLGLQHFRYYDSRLAEAVTTNGQVMLKYGMNRVNIVMNKLCKTDSVEYVIYGDTDSFFIHFDTFVQIYCKGMSESEIVTYLENFVKNALQPKLDVDFQNLLKDFGTKNQQIFFKLEKIGHMLITGKKRYIFDMFYDEGVRFNEMVMKVMGIEIVRSSTPSIVKDYLKDIVRLCIRSDESAFQKKIQEIKEDFLKQPYHAISFPRGVNGMKTYSSNISIYMKGCPIHVRGALLYNHHLKKLGLDSKYPLIADGDKIKFVYLKKPNHIYEDVIAFPAKLPEEFDLIKYVDKEMQFEKTFLKPIEGISSAIKWHTKEQPSLDSLFD